MFCCYALKGATLVLWHKPSGQRSQGENQPCHQHGTSPPSALPPHNHKTRKINIVPFWRQWEFRLWSNVPFLMTRPTSQSREKCSSEDNCCSVTVRLSCTSTVTLTERILNEVYAHSNRKCTLSNQSIMEALVCLSSCNPCLAAGDQDPTQWWAHDKTGHVCGSCNDYILTHIVVEESILMRWHTNSYSSGRVHSHMMNTYSLIFLWNSPFPPGSIFVTVGMDSVYQTFHYLASHSVYAT